MPTDELSVDFTTEELLLLAERCGVEPPAGLTAGDTLQLPAEYRQAIREQAEGALRARRVLGEDGTEPVEAVVTLLSVLGRPALLTTASIEQGGVVETRFYASNPDLAVEHRSLATSVHRLLPFATRDLLSRVLGFVDLRPVEPPAVPALVATVATLEACSTKVAEHDHHAAVAVLTQAGAPSVTAEAFVEALKAKRASASVTILYRPEDDKVAGGQLTWIDAGLRGLWVSEATEGDRLEVIPRPAEEIAKELLSYLPQPFSEPPPPGGPPDSRSM